MIRYVVILFFCLSANGTLVAQEGIYEDFLLWTQANLDAKISKDWSTDLKLMNRRDFNAGRHKARFAQLRVSYDWFKKSNITGGYRLTDEKGKRKHRLMLQTGYRYRLKPFDLIYRLRAEHDFLDNEFELLSEVRNRLTVRYRKKKYDWQPFVAIEVFNQERRGKMALGKMRYKAGVNYEVAKRQELGISYIIQQDYYVSSPKREYILNLSFTQKLNFKRKKKKNKKDTEKVVETP